jgi:hypothetical protein
MALRRVFFIVCLVASVFCLAGGYGIAGQWPGVVMAILTGFAWLLARKYPTVWLPLTCLVASVGLAVVGLLTGSPPWLMICGSGIALAACDLLFLDVALGSNVLGKQTRHYEINHLQLLALALGFGLSGIFLGRWLHLQVSFLGVVILVALAVFGLDRVWGYLKKTA